MTGSCRSRVSTLLETGETRSPAKSAVQVLLITFILISVAAAALETEEARRTRVRRACNASYRALSRLKWIEVED